MTDSAALAVKGTSTHCAHATYMLLLYLSDWLLKGKNHPWDEFIVTCHVNKLCQGRKH